MANVKVFNMQGAAVGEIALSDEVFGVEPHISAMHAVVRAYMNAQRQGTQSALTRTEVRGGGRKIYRQKGTGNARHHGNRAPQFAHGGVVFAPQPRDYVVNVPKKVRRLAMKSALTEKFNDGDIIVVDQIKFEEVKTKYAAKMLDALKVEKRSLLVLEGRDESIIRATKNLPILDDSYVNTLNVYDILRANKLIVTRAAMENIQEVYA